MADRNEAVVRDAYEARGEQTAVLSRVILLRRFAVILVSVHLCTDTGRDRRTAQWAEESS